MILRSLAGLPVTGVGVVIGTSLAVTDHLGTAVRAAGGAMKAASDAVRTAQSASASGATSSAHARDVVSEAVMPRLRPAVWQYDGWVHVPLATRGRDGWEAAEREAEAIAHQLADHSGVRLAYWNPGLQRLVVQGVDGAATERAVDTIAAAAKQRGLTIQEQAGARPAHPGDLGDVRIGAMTIALNTVGLAAAVIGRTLLLPPLPRWVRAANVVLREHPVARRTLRRAAGRRGSEVLRATVNAAVNGLGQEPVTLLLDTALRADQLAEAANRVAAFHAAHEELCAPTRGSAPARPRRQRPSRESASEIYSTKVVNAGLLAAAATWVVAHNLGVSAQTMLASSPRASRYGPSAFQAELGRCLAQEGVLVRAPERLRLLGAVDTVLLHPSALCGKRRAVWDVQPAADGWSRQRLWQAASAALTPVESSSFSSEASVRLSHLPDLAETDWVTATVDGMTAGRVLVGWELDPLAAAVLRAARQANLRVVLAGDPARPELAALIDEATSQSLAETVHHLQDDHHVVLTIACPTVNTSGAKARSDVGQGLVNSDIALAIAHDDGVVTWDADLLASNGLPGVWRVLTALPEARHTETYATRLAKASAVVAGLLLLTDPTGGLLWQRLTLRLAISPVNLASASALVTGWLAARRVALLAPPATASPIG
jgi:cation-transporting ATPase I